MEIWLVKPIKQSVFIATKHESQANRSKKSDNWLKRQEKSSKVRCLDDVGVLIAKLKFIKSEYFVQLCLAREIFESSLWVSIVFLSKFKHHVKRVNKSAYW